MAYFVAVLSVCQHLHVVPPPPDMEEFYHTRHSSVVDTFLHSYRFLLVLDADNLAVNMSRSLDHIVNATPLDAAHPYTDVDVFFHMREGGEVTASTYFLRNSAYSYCFVHYWRSMAPSQEELRQGQSSWVQTPNNDNGDLVAALMNIIHPEIALQCSSSLRGHDRSTSRNKVYDNKILLCFRLFRGALVTSLLAPRVKVFFIREDFFRMHSGHTVTHENMLLHKDASCHLNDVIIHGWKELGARYWPDSSGRGSSVRKFPRCDVDRFRSGGGGNPVCRWLTREAEIEIVRRHCYWRSPLCRRSDNSSINECTRGASCWERERINLARWALCLEHGVCDPYLSIAHIRDRYTEKLQLALDW